MNIKLNLKNRMAVPLSVDLTRVAARTGLYRVRLDVPGAGVSP